MRKKAKEIISVSRRTDIPAFHYDWLQQSLKDEVAVIKHPRDKTKNIEVNLSPEEIHSIVLWSKDFSKVAKAPEYLQAYNLFFQYTITYYSKFLEPHTPERKETLKTLEKMLTRYRPEQFNIRFDPIIISNMGEVNPTPHKPGLARLQAFEQLCMDLQSLGMDNCRITTSYLSMYGHVATAIKQSGLDIVDLSGAQQVKFLERMVEIADKYNRTIYSCSNPILEQVAKVEKSSCIDGELLTSLFGEIASTTKDAGQRAECGCAKSRDIGSYTQRCGFKCKYCYASELLGN